MHLALKLATTYNLVLWFALVYFGRKKILAASIYLQIFLNFYAIQKILKFFTGLDSVVSFAQIDRNFVNHQVICLKQPTVV